MYNKGNYFALDYFSWPVCPWDKMFNDLVCLDTLRISTLDKFSFHYFWKAVEGCLSSQQIMQHLAIYVQAEQAFRSQQNFTAHYQFQNGLLGTLSSISYLLRSLYSFIFLRTSSSFLFTSGDSKALVAATSREASTNMHDSWLEWSALHSAKNTLLCIAKANGCTCTTTVMGIMESTTMYIQ